MLKNGIVKVLALTALLGVAACGDEGEMEEDAPATVEALEPAPEPQVAPEVMDGAVMMDTSMVGTAADTAL